jgi:hypothetical protein
MKPNVFKNLVKLSFADAEIEKQYKESKQNISKKEFLILSAIILL